MIIFLNSTPTFWGNVFLNVTTPSIYMETDENLDASVENQLSEKVDEIVDKITESKQTNSNPREELIDEKEDYDGPSSKIPRVWDPHEVDFLVNNRKHLSNEEMKEFFERDSELHENKEELKQFNNSEEKFIVQNYSHMSVEEIADQLDRNKQVVSLKMKIMGLKNR